MSGRTKDRPIDLLEHGADGLLRNFHRAVFLIRRPEEPLNEEALLVHFEHACAYCRKPFTPERREHQDQIIATQDFGDPWALHNLVASCSSCRRVRNGSWTPGFMHQVLGPALGVEADEIDRRIQRIGKWTRQYRLSTPEEIFGSSAHRYLLLRDVLRWFEDFLLELLGDAETHFGGDTEAHSRTSPDSCQRRHERIIAARNELWRRHSIQNGEEQERGGV